MEKNKVLYQIKAFDKQIIRYFMQNTKECLPKITHIPTPTQMQIVEYLILHKDEEIYQRDLESVLNLRRATVSGVLQTMEKNNLIERIVPQEDARAKKIKIKEEAKKIFEKNKEEFRKIGEIACEGLEEEELNTFCDVLRKMKRNLEKLDPKVATKKKGVDDL